MTIHQGADPDIGAVLSPTMAQAIEQQREAYRYALRNHDWHYEQSSDQSAWRRGVTERNRLEVTAKSVDPDFRIWNEEAPSSFRKTYVSDGRASGDLDFGAWPLPGVVR